MTTTPGLAVRDALRYRPVRPDELDACAEVWRVSINDYTRRLNQPDMEVAVAPLIRLYGHLRDTDPDRFVVAVQTDRAAGDAERVVGFASAIVRERLWFLSM